MFVTRSFVIYDVTHDELYHAFQGEGAYMNDTKLGKMKEVPLEESILAINATWITENRRIDPSVLSPLVKPGPSDALDKRR